MTDQAPKQAKKQSTKALQTKRRRRRQFLTFVRMVRYGVNNFSRNAWLTIAATAVMTITLLIIFLTVAAQNILHNSISSISNNVSMSVYLKTDTTDEQVKPIIERLEKLKLVKQVVFIDSEKAKQDIASDYKTNPDVINALNEANNQLPASIRITVKNLNDTAELDKFVDSDADLKKYISTSIQPSYLGSKREIINKIGRSTQTAQNVGWVASIVFVIISALIIFNTIRMAIFSRKEEIQMMKLIGADRRFIRGPFIVEAIVYGFIGAVLATAAGYGVLNFAKDKLAGSGIDVGATLDLVVTYIGFVLLVMIVLGALIGTVSSLLATRRYLKL